MFANNVGLIAPYTELVSEIIQRVPCREIGLKIQMEPSNIPCVRSGVMQGRI